MSNLEATFRYCIPSRKLFLKGQFLRIFSISSIKVIRLETYHISFHYGGIFFGVFLPIGKVRLVTLPKIS